LLSFYLTLDIIDIYTVTISHIPHVLCIRIDGLKSGPIVVGEVGTSDNWLYVAKPVIEARMSRYNATETHFSLMTICPRRSSQLSQQIKLMEDSDDVTDNAETLERLRGELAHEMVKEERQRTENVRRRHNYIPLAVTLMRALARKGSLTTLRAAAAEKKSARR
jgi:ubiquitin carboxyl-terminal hydrolase L5